MKLITALVRPERLHDITNALALLSIVGLTTVEVQDYAPQSHPIRVCRGREYDPGSSLKLELRVVVDDGDTDCVVDAIVRTGRTGRKGDGHVCVMSIDHRFDIRTGFMEGS